MNKIFTFSVDPLNLTDEELKSLDLQKKLQELVFTASMVKKNRVLTKMDKISECWRLTGQGRTGDVLELMKSKYGDIMDRNLANLYTRTLNERGNLIKVARGYYMWNTMPN